MENLKNIEISTIDWKLILINYDTIKFIPKSDLIYFSKSCKYIRTRLFPIIFKRISLKFFSKGMIEWPLNTMDAEHENEALNRYKENLNSLIPHVRYLFFGYEHNEILYLTIPQIFIKLNTLHLSNISITSLAFHKLMNELNLLEALILEDALLIVFDISDTLITLQLPRSLKSFRISYGKLLRTEFDSNFKFSDYMEYKNETYIDPITFNIESDSLPNLKVLEIDQDYEDFIETQNNIILASNQITHLKTRFALLEELSSINLQFLTSLTLTNIHQYHQENLNPNFPTLQNLKELKILSVFALNELEVSLIPTRLKISANIGKNVKKLTLAYFKFDKFSIEELIENFNHLLELNLVTCIKPITLNNEKFPQTIKALNFYKTKPNLLNINSIKSCPGLKSISIYYEAKGFDFEETEFSKEIEGWRVIHFPGTGIKCYKN